MLTRASHKEPKDDTDRRFATKEKLQLRKNVKTSFHRVIKKKYRLVTKYRTVQNSKNNLIILKAAPPQSQNT